MDINISAFRIQEDRQRAARQDILDMVAKHYEAQGEILVQGTGFVPVTVSFQQKYLNPPKLAVGAYLKDGQNVEANNAPEYDVTVIRWETDKRPPAQLYYIGATLGIKTYGLEGQVLVIQYSFNGLALSSPSGSGLNASLEDPI